MIPVLFSMGNFSITSFGIFLILSIFFGLFLIWRVARAWDLDEEKVLDLSLLTIVGASIGARVYFILEHFSLFGMEFHKWILFYKYPGFSFWGAFLGGWLTLLYFAKRFRVDFLQISDIASVGLLGGLAISDIGCFLGGCNIGVPSQFFLSFNMVGVIGKRFPVQILEAILLSLLLLRVWSKATHFHKHGTIWATTFIFFGLINLFLKPLKVYQTEGYFFSGVILVLGLSIFYKVTKRNVFKDIQLLLSSIKRFPNDSNFRKQIVSSLNKSWYNHKVTIAWNFKRIGTILRRLNVRYQHKNSKFY